MRLAVHRFRKRYGELFREEVDQTVSDPTRIENEMRQLRGILSEQTTSPELQRLGPVPT